ncbi:MAG: sigma-70 family RNA polymerase sigma factor [Candidatus Krumholzibacteriota bacterium]|nr:sigma-70 family RNA polymerase sigma factor [Candidatus Krumholzibacteriota bacterium]
MKINSSSPGDKEIIHRILDGNIDDFELLLERYRDHVFKIVAKRIPPAQMEEIAHEVFVRAYRSLAGFRGKSPFGHWLAKIAIRTCYDFWRDRYRCPEVPMSLLDREGMDFMNTVAVTGARASFRKRESSQAARELLGLALNHLSAEDRTVIEMIHLEHYSVKETAAILGWSRANVKVRAFRARKKLRHLLERLLTVNRRLE